MSAPNVTHRMTVDGLELISVADLGDGRELRCSTRWRTAAEAADAAPDARASFEARAVTVDPEDGASTTQVRRARTPWGHLAILTVHGSPFLTVPQIRRVTHGLGVAWLNRVAVMSKL